MRLLLAVSIVLTCLLLPAEAKPKKCINFMNGGRLNFKSGCYGPLCDGTAQDCGDSGRFSANGKFWTGSCHSNSEGTWTLRDNIIKVELIMASNSSEACMEECSEKQSETSIDDACNKACRRRKPVYTKVFEFYLLGQDNHVYQFQSISAGPVDVTKPYAYPHLIDRGCLQP